jgi:cold shock CspA family protein
MEGTVSRWFPAQGFGFVTPDNAGPDAGTDKDIFVHRHAIPKGMDSLPVGTRVIFDVENDAFGRRRAKRPVVPLAESDE